MDMVGRYGAFIGVVKAVLFYVGLLVALICAIDWAVRTRRVNPFSKVARFFRARIDPVLAPVERVIVRAGGVPSSAAWWGLVAYAVLGILLISLLQLAGQILFQFVVMTEHPSEAWRVIVMWVFSALKVALLVRVLSSWFPISPYSRWIRWSYALTSWMLVPLQRIVPRIGMLDITPIIAYFALNLIESAILA